MKKVKLREQINYTFDKIMDKGTFALILFLLAVTILVSTIAGIVLASVQSEWSGGSLINSIWKSFLLTLDPGNQLAIEGNIELVAMTAIMTFCGIAFITTLIGIINSGITNKYDKLRQGTSKVIEKKHTIVLGFNDNVYRIISELVKANADKDVKWYVHKPRIVILGNEDICEMEQKVNSRIFRSVKNKQSKEAEDIYGVEKAYKKNTKLIYRTGVTSNPDDLGKCSIETSQSVIINEYEDSDVIKTILAIAKIFANHQAECTDVFVVTSINDTFNKEVAEIAGEWKIKEDDGNLNNETMCKFTEVLCFDDIISRMIAQTIFQPGLSEVYTELINFSGDEIYTTKYKGDKTNFSNILNVFENATVIGMKRKDGVSLSLKSEDNTDNVVCTDDEIIYIAKDSKPENRKESKDNYILEDVSPRSKISKKHEGIAIFGWNRFLENILSELNKYFIEIIDVIIFVRNETDKEKIGSFVKHDKLKLNVQNYNIKENIEHLKERCRHVLVLSDLECDVQKSDAETMALLMRLRKLKKKDGYDFNLTSQILDVKNRELVQFDDINDFVISSDIVSLMLAQISQHRELTPIFEKLLDAEGVEIYLKPASCFVELGKETKVGQIVCYAANKRNEIFIGYKKKGSKIKINPPKTAKVEFKEEDMIIVISENGNFAFSERENEKNIGE